MKKLLIAILLVMCLCITGCTFRASWGETEAKETEESKPMFERLYADVNISVFIDTETNVMYVVYHGGSGAGGITVMVDQDGKPRLWEE